LTQLNSLGTGQAELYHTHDNLQFTSQGHFTLFPTYRISLKHVRCILLALAFTSIA